MPISTKNNLTQTDIDFDTFKQIILDDFYVINLSREASLLGRKEVLTGKAKFGIFGDGKELPQIALSKVFEPGDFRSGYYRDQTIALATGQANVKELFAQLYANTDVTLEPHSAGRMMNAHFATRLLDESGMPKSHTNQKNSAADASPTASQMPRALGLAAASKYYRQLNDETVQHGYSVSGNEVVFATIGDASTSEGHFWETLNAAGVMQVPLVISVWDDGYGISVPIELQTTKGSISEICSGFYVNENGQGIDIYAVKGWDYPALVETYQRAVTKTRSTHIPCLIHVQEITQPQGHSTSGSHERYKSKERLKWEQDFDGILRMKNWLIQYAIATEDELNELATKAVKDVREQQSAAWMEYLQPIKSEIETLGVLLEHLSFVSSSAEVINAKKRALELLPDPMRRNLTETVKHILYETRYEDSLERAALVSWLSAYDQANQQRYHSNLYSTSNQSALHVPRVDATYSDDAPLINGFEILNACFDQAFTRDRRLVAFGEDLGKIGDVNQGFSGLQAKHGVNRIYDVGIREATIMGQGIGMALRGLRPIAEIQYLDYLLYGLQPLSDDLATLRYRTANGQQAPLIVRTRGHRLEGIWHTGSPMGMVINALRGMYICVPRNMTQAAGFYNLLLQSDDPALIIECLNGYRLKEKLPLNIDTFTVPLGVPEILRNGSDITLVTYGSCCRVAISACDKLSELSIDVELIDVQTLIPFDIHHVIKQSVKKTNRIVFLDEDVPGGASAYMLQQVMEEQDIFQYLDAKPATLTATENRSAYASDGDYYCKPNAEQIIDLIYGIMHESDPSTFPALYR
jgi:pyruvate/2-oxoglutarate/acetoin dehydrogenase E1 component/TPP-dependent pyruvate/acetoin dehydrogenase alpha subunit